VIGIRCTRTDQKPSTATLSPGSLAILTAYVKKLGVDIAPNAPLFRNRSVNPYSKDTLGDDFRDVREAVSQVKRASWPIYVAPALSRAPAAARLPTSPTRWRARFQPAIACARPTIRSMLPASVASTKRGRKARSVTAPAFVKLLEQAKLAKWLNQWRERRGSNPRPPA
jgi:hypothetical protein